LRLAPAADRRCDPYRARPQTAAAARRVHRVLGQRAGQFGHQQCLADLLGRAAQLLPAIQLGQGEQAAGAETVE